MKTTRHVTVLAVVLGLAGQLCAQNGQVRFRGTVTTDEAHNVAAVCYGDYHVTVDIDAMLADPNGALTGARSVQVCYEVAMRLAIGDSVEVNGYYWGGTCPKQYCNRVQILEPSDYIRLCEGCNDADWMVAGDDMYSIPAGNVGIGTDEPTEKLHVAGTALIERATGGQFDEALRVVKAGTGRQLVAYLINPTDGSIETEVQLAGGKMLPWAWSLRAASGSFSIGSVAVIPPTLNMTSTGFVGLGDTDPSYRLELPNTASAAGQGRANAWKTYSSGRWKTNIETIHNAMDKVRQLRGVRFDWKESGVQDIGLIAEEVGRVVPEVVDYEANGTDASSLAYDRLVALLVEALKEQDARIAELEQEVAKRDRLEQRLEAIERLIEEQNISRTRGELP
jgi:hypothetical protein